MVKIGNKFITSKNNCRKYTLLYVPIHFYFETPVPKSVTCFAPVYYTGIDADTFEGKHNHAYTDFKV